MVWKIKPRIRQVNRSSDEEIAARAYVLDLRTFASGVTSQESFCEMYGLLYSVLNKLGPECQDLAEKSQEQFQHLIEIYDKAQQSNNQDEIKTYRQETIKFADELEEKVFELCPLGELEVLTKNGTYRKV